MNASEPRRGIPLRPDGDALARAERQLFCRSIACRVLGTLRKEDPRDIAQKAWPDDTRIARAATAPLNTTAGAAAGISQARVGDLLLVAPGSAAAQLFARCLRIDLGRVLQIAVPHAASHAVPQFAAESTPISVAMSPIATSTIGPVRKLPVITTISRELENANPENMTTILSRLLGEAAAKALDLAVFGNAAASTAQPAGLLNGVTPLPASTGAATVADTAAGDIATIAQAFSDAWINPQNMILITSPKSAWNLKMALGFQTAPLPILMSSAVPPGTVIAVAPEAVASATDGDPEVELAMFASLHFDDATAADLVSIAGVVAAPAMSTFQQDLVAIKLKIKTAWASLQPGAVQTISGAKW